MDLCFEFAAQVMRRLSGAVEVADEVQGFRYFDERDLIGFVDGTESPGGAAGIDAAIAGADDEPGRPAQGRECPELRTPSGRPERRRLRRSRTPQSSSTSEPSSPFAGANRIRFNGCDLSP